MKYKIISIDSPNITVKFLFDDLPETTQTIAGLNLEDKEGLEIQLSAYAKAFWLGKQEEKAIDPTPSLEVEALVGKEIPVKQEVVSEE